VVGGGEEGGEGVFPPRSGWVEGVCGGAELAVEKPSRERADLCGIESRADSFVQGLADAFRDSFLPEATAQLGGLLRDEDTDPFPGVGESITFQVMVGLGDGVGVYDHVRCKLADRRELVVRDEKAGGDPILDSK